MARNTRLALHNFRFDSAFEFYSKTLVFHAMITKCNRYYSQSQETVCFSLKICSVADPGYLTRILIFISPRSRIKNKKTATKEKGGREICSPSYLFVTNYHKT